MKVSCWTPSSRSKWPIWMNTCRLAGSLLLPKTISMCCGPRQLKTAKKWGSPIDMLLRKGRMKFSSRQNCLRWSNCGYSCSISTTMKSGFRRNWLSLRQTQAETRSTSQNLSRHRCNPCKILAHSSISLPPMLLIPTKNRFLTKRKQNTSTRSRSKAPSTSPTSIRPSTRLSQRLRLIPNLKHTWKELSTFWHKSPKTLRCQNSRLDFPPTSCWLKSGTRKVPTNRSFRLTMTSPGTWRKSRPI